MKKVFLNEFSTAELEAMFAAGSIDSAITVFGSCESHGGHLPLGPDLFVPTEVARQAAQRLARTVVVPGVPFGTSMHYNANPMAISLRFETVTAVAEDMFESLLAYGIRHIFVLNGHDGNIAPLEIAQRKVKQRHPEAVFAFMPAWWYLVGKLLGEDFFAEWDGLGHGGEGETSITMAVRPELCDLGKAVRQMPADSIRLGERVQIMWDIAEVSATGATGDPTRASAEKGSKMLDALVALVVDSIRQLDDEGWRYDRRQ
ncbi:creatininase family protein [Cupriavidus sp. WGtm5]|uniref:creatininase family protein n=1 Tax=Cupriavidus sp. WGtm5 TaxID=2919926 RepID=UPI0020915446|nr:creatininase family protein [Cupriavidus sp. WGtm5]MCO4892372.1 creatininase family protein [Cupriavidus sp. WGtm5]